MIDEEKRRIAQEISEILSVPTLKVEEITIAQYVGEEEITYRQAQSALDRGVREGRLERRKVFHQSHWCWAYRLKQE